MNSPGVLVKLPLPEVVGDGMDAVGPTEPTGTGPWPKLDTRMLPQECLLSSPLLALLAERL